MLNIHFRGILFAGLGVLGCVGGGWNALFTAGHSPGTRVLGVALIFGGLLLFTSYYLHLSPGALSRDFWKASTARRTARWVLDYTWRLYFTALGVLWIAILIDQWAR